MTVKEFIQKYNGDIDCLEIRKYIPIQEKIGTINSVLKELIEVDGKISASYNTVSLELGRVTTAITLYTNLEIKSMADYDTLAENKLIRPILECIGDDVLFFNQCFDDRKNDYIRESNSIDGIFGRLVNEINNLMGKIDPNKISELLSLLDSKE